MFKKILVPTDGSPLAHQAAEFAAEETEHVQALDDWLARTERPSAPWALDPER